MVGVHNGRWVKVARSRQTLIAKLLVNALIYSLFGYAILKITWATLPMSWSVSIFLVLPILLSLQNVFVINRDASKLDKSVLIEHLFMSILMGLCLTLIAFALRLFYQPLLDTDVHALILSIL